MIQFYTSDCGNCIAIWFASLTTSHLSSQREAQVQSTVMWTAAQTATSTSLPSTSSSSLSSGSVSRGRSDQAHQGGAELKFGLAVALHLPLEGPGLGEGGHWVSHQPGRGPVDG